MMCVMWNLIMVCLETVLVLVQCMICTKHTIGSEIILNAPDSTPTCLGPCGSSFWSVCVPQAQKLFWMHQMKLLGDVRQVESHFGLFANSVSVGAMPNLHQTHHRL
jgi:hypothetical protein